MFSLNTTKKFITFAILLSLGMAMLPPVAQAADPISVLDNRVEEIDGKTVNIIWKTDTATKGKIIFGTSAQAMNYFIVDNADYRTYHEVELGNLQPETTYYYQIVVYNGSEQATSYVRSFKTDEYNDGLAPQLSNVEVAYVSGNAAFISWNTQEDSTSVVQYSIDESYSSTAYNNKKVQEHEIALKNLRVNTLYYMRAYSVDADGNQSSYHYRTFRTDSTNAEDKETFVIENFRPATDSDVLVGTDQVTIRFNTNHYAYGSVSIARSGFKTQTQQLEYDTTHQATFENLSAGTEYTITCSVRSMFNVYLKETYNITTKKIIATNISNSNSVVNPISSSSSSTSSGSDNVVVAGVSYTYNSANATATCDYNTLNSVGYYGQYYNLPYGLNGLENTSYNTYAKAVSAGWYGSQYFVFDRIDEDLIFNEATIFTPIKEKTLGYDPYIFSASWRAILEVPRDMDYEYSLGVGNNAWVFIDGELVTNLGDLVLYQESKANVRLTRGYHYLEIFYVNRKVDHPRFWFNPNTGIIPHPWPVNCNLLPGGGTASVNTGGNGNNSNNGDTGDNSNIVVAGAEFSLYTHATALLKTYDSPDVWAIMNGQRHYISSPASFNEYGFNWYEIRTVTRGELEKYPRARLIRSGDGDKTIYYLYQRPEGQWLKINITSPTVFVSYPGNYWGNVIDVTQLDVDSYPDVKLIKTAGSNDIYYLDNNERHIVSKEVFVAHGFNLYEVAEVNETHMESYKIASPLK